MLQKYRLIDDTRPKLLRDIIILLYNNIEYLMTTITHRLRLLLHTCQTKTKKVKQQAGKFREAFRTKEEPGISPSWRRPNQS